MNQLTQQVTPARLYTGVGILITNVLPHIQDATRALITGGVVVVAVVGETVFKSVREHADAKKVEANAYAAVEGVTTEIPAAKVDVDLIHNVVTKATHNALDPTGLRVAVMDSVKRAVEEIRANDAAGRAVAEIRANDAAKGGVDVTKEPVGGLPAERIAG